MKVKVYQFRWWDGVRDQYVSPDLKRTADRIAQLPNCEIISGTEEEVEESALDEEGRYDPRH